MKLHSTGDRTGDGDAKNSSLAHQLTSPRGWPIRSDMLRTPPYALSAPVLAFGSIVAMVLIVFTVIALGRLGAELFEEPKRAIEATKVLLPLSAAAIGLPLIIWRLFILNRQTRTAEEKTQIDRETQFTSIFSKGVEQLGTTREHKETEEREGGLETQTRTVPNIEVRLGGIHSLSRLAEESQKDAIKIENLLLSYVSENSWITNEGSRIANFVPLTIGTERPWSASFKSPEASLISQERLASWKEIRRAEFNAINEWVQKLKPTRVDVAEAIISVATTNFRERSSAAELRDGLIIDRTIGADVFDKVPLKRCKLVRCTLSLDESSKSHFEDCTFVNCLIYLNGGQIFLNHCQVIACSVQNANGGRIAFFGSQCEVVNMELNKQLDVHSVRSVFSRCYISNEEPSVIELFQSTFVDCDLSFLITSEGSDWRGSVFPGCRFDGSDLRHLSNARFPMFPHASDDGTTRLPYGIRPTHWPSRLDE